MSDTVTSVEKDAIKDVVRQGGIEKLLINGGGNRYQVEWDTEAKVTPMGSLVFFAQYLQTSGLMDRLCKETPLAYKSNNAPKERDVLGTIVLSVLTGQTRYAHINALRGDQVSAEMLGVSKVVSEDSVRRALKRGTYSEWSSWLSTQERSVYEPLLRESYIVDIDNTVKPLYGHQEGAELGYNPHKPGRPSHNYHTYFIGSLRIVLGVEVLPGKKHSGKHSMPELWSIIDSLPKACRPRMIRGDIGYGNQNIIVEAEARKQPYLFKLKRTSNVKAKIQELARDSDAWADAGSGWQGAESTLKLQGWTSDRRCIFLRRPAQRESILKVEPTSKEFEFVELIDNGPVYEYTVLVTNDALPIAALAQLYRDRADCENVFDEIKNQWGWAGFVTRDLLRCRIIARLIALIYNWWNIFTRLAQPEKHMEAITSRPLLLHAVGRMVTTGRRKILRLTSVHAMSEKIRYALDRIGHFLNQLNRTAEQLSIEAVWAIILSAAFVKWLDGKILDPVTEGDQMLLRLPG